MYLSLRLLGRYTQRYAWLISQAFLNLINLTVKINYHRNMHNQLLVSIHHNSLSRESSPKANMTKPQKATISPANWFRLEQLEGFLLQSKIYMQRCLMGKYLILAKQKNKKHEFTITKLISLYPYNKMLCRHLKLSFSKAFYDMGHAHKQQNTKQQNML